MPVQLICLPFAGAGASFFWPWRSLDPRVTVRALQLPGREKRIDDEPFEDVEGAADALVAELIADPGLDEGPVALFGHSLGAVLAYELARRLRASGVAVARLFVSGSPGPWSPRARRATGLDDEQFLAEVETLAGYRHAAFDDPDMRGMLLPVLRADVEMHENYRPEPHAPTDVGVTALRGARDDLVTAEELAGWAAVTTGGCEQVELPGGHMYLTDSARAVLSIVVSRCTPVPAGRG